MTAKVIDFFVEAGKRSPGFTAPTRAVEPSSQLTPTQVRITILLDLIINEIRSGAADPTNFFVLYGKPWEENPKEMLWHYLSLEFTPQQLRHAVEQIIADMKRRKG